MVVEALAPASRCEAPAETLAAVMALAQQAAREVRAKHGACLLILDTEGPLRCHVHAPPGA